MNIQSKINKLIKALSIKGQIYLFNKEQFYSNKLEKVCGVNKLFHLMPIEEYNLLYPTKKKDPNKYDYVKVEILSTFKPQEILIELAELYKKVGESSE